MASNDALRYSPRFSSVAWSIVGSLLLAWVAVPAAQAEPTDPSGGEEQNNAVAADNPVAGDAVSASVNARLLGEKVEVLASRTSTSSTFALPDGTWETVLATGPVWVPLGGDGTAESDWAAFDATLIKGTGDWYVARAHEHKVAILGGGAGNEEAPLVFAQVTDPVTGYVSELTYPGDLPVPEFAGPRATFVNVRDGVDMVVEVTSTGVEQFFVVHEKPQTVEDASFLLGVTVPETVVEETPDGTIAFVGGDDEVVASVTAPLVWDAVADAQRADPVTMPWVGAETPARWAEDAPDAVEQDASTLVDVGAGVEDALVVEVDTSGEQTQVSVAPTQALLERDDVVFPLVIDPSISLSLTHDTYVQSGITSSKATDGELRVGTYNGGTNKARSFMNVNVAPILGKKITSATLKLYQFHSWSCTAKPWVVGSTATTSASTVWTNQPGLVKNYVTVTDAKGYSSSCAAGWSSANVTAMMQDYANGTAGSRGIRLAASSETDNFGWKKFRSGNATSNKPTLSVTYNSYPNNVSSSSLTPGQFQWFGTAPNRTLYVRNATPTITAIVADADGGNVRGQFHLTNNTTGAVVADWGSGNYVASGGTSSYKMPTLVNGHTYSVKVRGSDGSLGSKTELRPWETSGKFTVDLVAPTMPKVTSNKYTDGGWINTAASGTTFALESTTDTSYFEVKKDKGAVERVTASGGKATVSWSPGAGYHTIKVKAVDRAGLASGEKTFTFGAGGVTLTSQMSGLKSTDRFTTTMAGPPSASDGSATATTYVREVGSTTASDNTANGGAGAPWTEVAGTTKAFTGSYAATWSATPFATSKGLERRVMAMEVQVCVKYVATGGATTTKCSWNSGAPAAQKPTVIRVPHAFGDNYPTVEAGPGQVALWTGEYNYSETDVSVPGYAGDLSMSRTYSSLSGVDSDSVFGPGWQANFDGTDIGIAGWEVFDSTAQDGVIALVDPEGEPLVYQHTTGTKGDRKAGKYVPIDDDTAEFGASLELLSDRVTMVFTEDDGTKTFFAFANSTWAPSKIQEPGSPKATTFVRNTNGTVARILAPTPDGVTCTASAPLLAPGCRALDITYTTIGGKQRVNTVSYVAYDPAKTDGAGMTSVEIAKYGYETAAPHRLIKVTYPHTADSSGPASARSVDYTYGPGASSSGQPLLATLKPAGLQPFTLVWGKTVHDPKSLLAVSRTAPSGGSQVQQSRFAYGIPLTGQANLPVINAAMANVYGQAAPAVYGAAVFSADRTVSTGDLNQIVMPSADDWRYADLQYTDLDGRVVNTANFGAGTWQFTAADYDAKGNEIRSLDERATAQLRAVNGNGELGQTDIDTYATLIKYNEETPTNPQGTLVTDVWTPAVNTDAGLVRVHTHTNYDQGAPNAGINPDTTLPYRLPTETIVTQVPAGDDTSTPVVLSRSTTGYNPVDGAAATSDTSGWKHGVPTLVTNHMDNPSDNVITKSVLDSEGRVLKSIEPGSNGSDAGTSLAGFYTAGPQTAVFGACGNKPQWAGMNCMTTTGETTPTVPSTLTAYSMFMAPALVTETLGAATRVTTTTFNKAGQPTKVDTTVQGVTGSVAMGSTETLYDQATGNATTTIARNSGGMEIGRISTQADGWGRETTYTDNYGKTSTTTYDALSRVVTFTDSAGKTTTNTYGDANERRGHLTKTDTTGAGTFTATYDSIGDMTSQTLAGGKVTQHIVREPRSGAVTTMSYTIQPTTGDAVEVLAWSMTNDAQDRITQIESQANGAPVIDEETGEVIGFGSLSRTQQFEFDKANRLTKVNDNAGGICATRTYGFSTRGHRLSLGEATKICEDTGTATTSNKTWTYDQADRMQTGANNTGTYQYDPLGRQTKLPAIDTPQGTSAGDLSITYYDDDSARSITQNGVTTTYDLDPAGRRSTSTTTNNGVTSTTKRYYADGSDNPTWATVNDGVNPEKTTWYGGDIGGSLGIEVTDSAKFLTLNDPLGSVATTIDITDANQSPIMGMVGTYDEYGVTITNPGPTGAISYGWLGGKERAQDTTGLILMGARLYNNITGHFTSVDPVPGGNTTAYTYPQDPINELDLDGNLKIPKWVKKTGKFLWKHKGTIALTALSFVPMVGAGVGVARMVIGTQRIASNYAKTLRILRTSKLTGKPGANFARNAATRSERAAQVGKPCPSCKVKMTQSRQNLKGQKKDMRQVEGDHIVPKSLGGNNGPFNRNWVCARCNNRKGGR